MGFSLEHISLANLFQNGQNYIVFSIMGMLIVFVGLTFISLYITLLPRILNLTKLRKAEKTEQKKAGKSPDSDTADAENIELLLAIAVALHLDQASDSGYEKITWNRHEEQESAWLTAGRMSSISVRSHLPERRS